MLIKIVRATKDAELATTPQGKRVMKVSFAYDIGYGQNKKPQFVSASMWGDRGDKIAQYITKGVQFEVIADDMEAYTYQKQSGETVAAMRCTIRDVVLCGGRSVSDSAQSNTQANLSTAGNKQAQPQGGFADFDDQDIPF